MKYQGSKNRLAKQLLEAIPRNGEVWVEPFVGGCGMIKHVDRVSKKIGADSNKYIISLWNSVKAGWQPPYIHKSEYEEIKIRPDEFAPEVVAFAAVGCSFQGGWFNGYTAITKTKIGTIRDYVNESRKAVIKLSTKISDVEFINCSYDQLEIPHNAIIYCDPPYENTKKYKDNFDHLKFWQWCRQKTLEGHKIYISEYSAPPDFECILEISKSSTMDHKSSLITTEKLFTYKGI